MIRIGLLTSDRLCDIEYLLKPPYLKELDSEKWRGFFSDRKFISQQLDNKIGHALICDNNGVVGFVGRIGSNQVVNGIDSSVTNLGPWVIDERFRGHGLKLVRESVRAEADAIITSITSSATAVKMVKKCFSPQLVSENYHLLNEPIFAIGKHIGGYTLDAKNFDDSEHRRIAIDHQNYGSHSLQVEVKGIALGLILRKLQLKKDYSFFKRKPMDFLEVSYATDLNLLHECQQDISGFLTKRYGVKGVIIDSMLSPAQYRSSMKRIPMHTPRMILDRRFGDGSNSPGSNLEWFYTLYSEVIVLGLNDA